MTDARPAGRGDAAPDLGELDDAALMARAGAGDRTAFNLLVGRHGTRALRLALRVLGDPAEAEEVAQEAFLRAWQAAAGFDPARARFTTWLHRIVVNLAIDRTRRRAPLPRPGSRPSANGRPGTGAGGRGRRHAGAGRAGLGPGRPAAAAARRDRPGL
ncbi:sigma-70 family RNA polymerase sigma factor [Paeniroseomonas aquatica]|uniref:sigma-70 family RNA polymerase sigma factor n=1 Tax=Paeniroseomonas aquatica TaxID=373043 RepID=UPI003612FA3B